MESLLPTLLIAAMVATLLVLAIGVVGFAFKSKINARYATQLMAARVALQFTAIAIIGILVLLKVT